MVIAKTGVGSNKKQSKDNNNWTPVNRNKQNKYSNLEGINMSNKNIAPMAKLSLVALALSTVTSVSAEDATADQNVERIQITGSSIKRADMEGALPVTTFSKEDIARTGVTSVPELVQQIPAMQGFTVGAQSVGAGSGAATASLRDLGSSYTLVLLNGRRMASRDSGSSVDISSIPLAAIERVDVLMDGASALYGSDAIAGVINFITKQDYTGTDATVRIDETQHGGGEKFNFDIATGFGDLDADGYNIMLAYTRSTQKQLSSLDREFSDTGFVDYTAPDGTPVVIQRASSNAIPANLYLKFDEDITGYSKKSYNPYREENGACADFNVPSGSTCLYDFTEMVQIFPEQQSDNFFVNGTYRLNDDAELYGNFMYANNQMVTRIAAKTVSNYKFDLDSGFVTDLLQPMLTPEEYAGLTEVKIKWRARPADSRTTKWDTDTFNSTIGIRGAYEDIDYDFAYTASASTREQSRIAGYLLAKEFGEVIESGIVDVFTTPENIAPDAANAVAESDYNGLWETTKTKSNTFQGNASMPVFEVPAGEVYLGTGFDYRSVSYSSTPSEANEQGLLFSYSPDLAFDMSREMYGMYAEMVTPVTDNLEITGAVRYDNIGKITDELREGEKVVNEDVDDVTYKLNGSWRPMDGLVVRASIGTGFKAPTMKQIAGPKEEAGWTSGSYPCPVGTSHELSQYCFEEPGQYRMAREGYSKLKPEKSEQKSVGFVYSPTKDFSFSIDWWSIDLEDQVKTVTEKQIIEDPVRYNDLFGTRPNTQSGELELQITRSPVNIGVSENSGIDWLVTVGHDFDFGTLRSTLRGARMLESKYLIPGDAELSTSLGKFGPNDAVTFEDIIKFNNTFSHGDFTHSLNISYKSGYQDQQYIASRDENGVITKGHTKVRLKSDLTQRYMGDIIRDVDAYMLVDYSTQWQQSDNLKLTFGIKNLFDEQPPLSLRTSGGGHQVGYDPRYVQELGRTFYLKLAYSL